MSSRWPVTACSVAPYEIRVCEPLLAEGNRALTEYGHVPGRRFVILDSAVAPSWQDRLLSYFRAHGIQPTFMVVPGGEQCKNLETVGAIIHRLRQFGLDRRNEPVILVGGGAVLDTGGFAASIYRRGVPFIRVPTTLLAYVDASVGIKTGVNVGTAKNLVGAFHPPALVLLDREFFSSLSPRDIASGLGEILKLGLGCDEDLFDMLDAAADTFATTRLRDAAGFTILARSIEVMLDELRPNIFERELCRRVDLGHTFSQAFEMSSLADPLLHGEAVALDLNLSALISVRRGLLSEKESARLANLTDELGLPGVPPAMQPPAVWDSLTERTQHRAGRQRAPLPLRIGECTSVDDLREDEVVDAFRELAARTTAAATADSATRPPRQAAAARLKHVEERP
jgi:3-dehydroquinate synthetase